MKKEKQLAQLVEEAIRHVQRLEPALRAKARQNHRRVLAAFRNEKVTDFHFNPSTGYGYGDEGREVLERVFARVFGGKAALVRGQIVSGTHAIYLGLKTLVGNGKKLLYIGAPYVTLKTALDLTGNGGPADANFQTEVFPLSGNGWVNLEALAEKLEKDDNYVIAIQRSCGYDTRRTSLSMQKIKEITNFVKNRFAHVSILVDNCYGEFVETIEPPMVGADLTAGSLIKNPGGGIAPGGGYLVGEKNLIARAADLLTAPGLGKTVGASFWDKRLIFQGLYLAPLTVLEALCGMVFSSYIMSACGFHVVPGPEDDRTDIIQRIDLGDRQLLEIFCRCIQKYSPVDAHVVPQPGMLPGYNLPVIMAAGTFVQGASLELSADAPVRPPYSVFLQGGLSREYTREIIINTLKSLYEHSLI